MNRLPQQRYERCMRWSFCCLDNLYAYDIIIVDNINEMRHDDMDEMEIAKSFAVLQRRTQGYVADAASPLGLTYMEVVLFLHISRMDGESQDSAAENLQVDKAAITRAAKRLEDKGYLYRQQDQRDKRMKRLSLTEMGRTAEPFLRNICTSWVDYLLEGVEDAKRKAFLDVFGHVSGRARNADIDMIVRGLPTAPCGR